MSRKYVVAALVVAGVLGCTKSDTVPVTGTVTFKGQPADQTHVIFNPTTGRVAEGVTDSTGKFSLSTIKPNDGALPGEYMVTLGEWYPPDKPPKMPPAGQGLPTRFARKYTDPATSPLKVTVERGKKNEFDFKAD